MKFNCDNSKFSSLALVLMLTLLYFYLGHKNWVLYIAWSPDGKHLASGSKSGELLTWDPQTGRQSGKPLNVKFREHPFDISNYH